MAAARSATGGRRTVDNAQEQIPVSRDRRRRLTDRTGVTAQPGGSLGQVRVPGPALAVFTVAMRRDRDIERHGPQVRDPTQPVYRRLGIAALELAVRRA